MGEGDADTTQSIEGGRMRFSSALVVAVLGLSGVVWGENNPFVGTWKLNVEKSTFDPGPPIRSRTVTIEQAGDGVRWSIETVDANGNRITVVEAPRLDGRDYPRTVTGSQGRPDTIALKRIDPFTLEETLKKDGKVVATFRQVVSKDGKVRTATQTMGTNPAGQPVHDVLVFDKQ